MHNIYSVEFDPRQAAVDYILQFIGQPYRWGAAVGGGDDPILGFDCSGLQCEVLKSVNKLGAKERLNSRQLRDRFPVITDPIAGALVFFAAVAGGPIIHVEMCIDKFQRVGASGGDSTTDTIEEAAVQNAFVKRRLIYSRPHLVAFVDPFLTHED